jgi:hypothetical protein
MEITEGRTVGSPPAETGKSGSDIAPDGSAVGTESDRGETRSESLWQRLLSW